MHNTHYMYIVYLMPLSTLYSVIMLMEWFSLHLSFTLSPIYPSLRLLYVIYMPTFWINIHYIIHTCYTHLHYNN